MKKLIYIYIALLTLVSCSESKIQEDLESAKNLAQIEKPYFLWYEVNPVFLLGKWKIKEIEENVSPEYPKNYNPYSQITEGNFIEFLDFKIDTSYIGNTILVKHIRKNNDSREIGEVIKAKYWRFKESTHTIDYSKWTEPKDYPFIGPIHSAKNFSIIDYNKNMMEINFYNGKDYYHVIYEKIETYEIDESYMIVIDWDTYVETYL